MTWQNEYLCIVWSRVNLICQEGIDAVLNEYVLRYKYKYWTLAEHIDQLMQIDSVGPVDTNSWGGGNVIFLSKLKIVDSRTYITPTHTPDLQTENQMALLTVT